MTCTIGIVYDLRSDYLKEGYTLEQIAELDTEATIEALDATLQALGHATDRIGHARALCARLVRGDRWDLVFNIAEGLRGRSREAQAPAILELYGVPYVFSDPLVLAATLDKAVAKRLVRSHGLPTPNFKVVASLSEAVPDGLRFPLFAKPIAEGTGKGIDERSRIDGPEELRAACARLLEAFGQQVLLEEYLPGREFTTAVIGTGRKARVIGTMEIEVLPAAARAIYSLEMKERCEEFVRYSAPPRDAVRRAVEDLALKSYLALECRDVGRVDIRLDADGAPSFMEVNPLPGLHPQHSDLPMIATQEGMPFERLIAEIVESARERARGAA